MRYLLNIDKSVNDLTHFAIRGRKYILILQSLLYPMRQLNDKFIQFAKDKHIEARMTSQVIYFEWFLNYKLNGYFINQSDQITIESEATKGVPIFHGGNSDTFVVWKRGTNNDLSPAFYHKTEELEQDRYSFIVNCPAIKDQYKSEFAFALKHWVDKYKTAGKTYLIKIKS